MLKPRIDHVESIRCVNGWKVHRVRTPNSCIYASSRQICSGSESPIVVFYVLSNEKCRGREHPVVDFMRYRVKSVEEESVQLLVLYIIV